MEVERRSVMGTGVFTSILPNVPPHLLENKKPGNTRPLKFGWLFFDAASKTVGVMTMKLCCRILKQKWHFFFLFFKHFTGAWAVLPKDLVYLLLDTWASFM